MEINVIEEIASLSQPTAKAIEGIPKIRHAIQCTPDHLVLDNKNRAAAKGFPVIDRMAFARKYMDKKFGIELPVFGFFNATCEPVITQCFQMVAGKPYFTGQFNTTLDGRIWMMYEDRPVENGLRCDHVDRIEPGQVAKFLPPPLPVSKKDAARGVTQNVPSVAFHAILRHIIPENIMQLVDKHVAEKTFANGLFIVADVRGCWQMESKQVPMNPDPLLVGVEVIDNEPVYFLVAKFDLTPAESYIVNEFIK